MLDVLQAKLAQHVGHLDACAIDFVQFLLWLDKFLGSTGAHIRELPFNVIDAFAVILLAQLTKLPVQAGCNST